MNTKKLFLLQIVLLIWAMVMNGQNVEVDINPNIKHSVGGVSDFGRERHITLHSSLQEKDWDGEHAKLDYLLNDLDVYMGRDNGSATWKFMYSKMDENRINYPDMESLGKFGKWSNESYATTIKDKNLGQYASHANEMICGANPHPTYPTLSYWHMCGEEGGTKWLPQNIQTSADWMVEYMDKFFVKSPSEVGEPLPKYWEVINEPDMLLNTGAFMMSSWEALWEYHNLVAKGIKARLGDKAPMIGGMTWGLHDLFDGDLNRFTSESYVESYYGKTPADLVAVEYAKSQVRSPYLGKGVNTPWFQWDVLWKGFMDAAGENMDFYSVHLYDWPTYDATGGAIRSGGHTEAALEMVEWYDVYKNGVAKRKPIVMSEYGAVQGAWTYKAHDKRYDWECMKPFSSMLMQFLERPDYIVKTMPFTPIKAEWGDVKAANGSYTAVYQYKMMRDDDHNGVWEWSDYIKWYQLWSEVKGTRVDTRSTNPDIQVDCYKDGKDMYLILNNLDAKETSINLNMHGNFGAVSKVNIKHLYLSGVSDIKLDNNDFSTMPQSVKLAANGTMIIKCTVATATAISETLTEKKYYAESLSGGVAPHRVAISAAGNTIKVNNVTVPSGTSEAVLKITGSFYDGHEGITSLKVNGTSVAIPTNWRGVSQNRSRYFGTLEIPFNGALLQANNTFTVVVKHVGELSCASLVVSEFTAAPGRTNVSSGVAVTGISLEPATVNVQMQRTLGLVATVAPANASDKTVTWLSSDVSIATVGATTGIVTPIKIGTVTITAKSTQAPTISKSCTVNVIAYQAKVAESVSLNYKALNATAKDVVALNATVLPIDAENRSVEWLTSDASVATVTAGVVTLHKAGKATITAKTVNGLTDNCVITVSEFVPTVVTGVEINKAAIAVRKGSTFELKATVLPANASDKSVKWTSSLPAIAKVNETTGLVTGVALGKATITATSTDQGKTVTCEVTVISSDGVLTIEAEAFTSTGGTTDDATWGGPGLGFRKNTTLIDYGNNGDWAQYTITIAETATYQLTYYIACPNNTASITSYIDGVEVTKDVVPNNGLGQPGYDAYSPLIAEKTVNLTAGQHTLKVLASGTNAWQWNLDKIEFVKVSATTSTGSDLKTGALRIYPNPVSDKLNVLGLDATAYTVTVRNIQGVVFVDGIMNGSVLNVSDLPTGYYFITLSDGVKTRTLPFSKIK